MTGDQELERRLRHALGAVPDESGPAAGSFAPVRTGLARRRDRRRTRAVAGLGVVALVAAGAAGLALADAGPARETAAQGARVAAPLKAEHRSPTGPLSCVQVQVAGGPPTCAGSVAPAAATSAAQQGGSGLPSASATGAAGAFAPNGPDQTVTLAVGQVLAVHLPGGAGLTWSPPHAAGELYGLAERVPVLGIGLPVPGPGGAGRTVEIQARHPGTVIIQATATAAPSCVRGSRTACRTAATWTLNVVVQGS